MEELKRLSECEEQVMVIVWEAKEDPDLKYIMGKMWYVRNARNRNLKFIII